MERRHQLGLDSYDRFFPSQDTMPKGGFGNLIALPLQHVFIQSVPFIIQLLILISPGNSPSDLPRVQVPVPGLLQKQLLGLASIRLTP